MDMVQPEHPGKAVRAECLGRHQLTVFQAAKMLGVTRQALNNLVNCHCGISPEMAVRLAAVFGGKPEAWLLRQMEYDLALAKARLANTEIAILPLQPVTEYQARLF